MLGAQTSLWSSYINRLFRRNGGGALLPFNNHPTLSNDLVSYWALDEQSGVRYDSVVASGNDLTDNNTVGFANQGPSGVVADFVTANEEYLSNAGTIAGVDATVSFACWVKATEVSARRALFCDASGNFYFALSASDAYPTIFTRAYNDSYAYTPGILDSQWHFLVVYHDATGNQLGISVDGGAFQTSATGGANGAISAYQLGVRIPVVLPEAFTGNMSDAGFWTTKLSPTLVTTLYNSGNGKSYADLTDDEKVGLVSYWNLDEVSGTRADSHGSNTLTDNNTVTSVTNAVPPPKNIAAKFTAANTESLSRVTPLLGAVDKSYVFWYLSSGAAATQRVFHDRATYLDVWHDSANNLQITLQGRDAGGYQQAQIAFLVEPLAWIMIYVEVDQGARIAVSYNDGALTTAVFGTETTDVQPFTISPSSIVNFTLDEMGVWSRVLTAQERTDLWNAGAGLYYSSGA